MALVLPKMFLHSAAQPGAQPRSFQSLDAAHKGRAAPVSSTLGMRADRAAILRLLLILASFAVLVSPRLSAEENTSSPTHLKEREFNKRFIEHLPREQREVYFRECQNDESKCPARDLISFAETMCRFVAEGRYKTRNEVVDSMGGFFIRAEAEALVDTAIEVICPQYRNRVP